MEPPVTCSCRVMWNVKFNGTPLTGGSGETDTSSRVATSPEDPQSDQPSHADAEAYNPNMATFIAEKRTKTTTKPR